MGDGFAIVNKCPGSGFKQLAKLLNFPFESYVDKYVDGVESFAMMGKEPEMGGGSPQFDPS